MVSKKALHKAVEENIISAEQAESLYQIDETEGIVDQGLDANACAEHKPKFMRSFGDGFIALGFLILMFSINMLDLSIYYYFVPIIGFIAAAEWLLKIRRLVLPGMAILFSLLFFVNDVMDLSGQSGLSKLFIMAVFSFIFYLRYKLPFSLLPLSISVLVMLILQLEVNVLESPLVFVVFGFIIFAVAFWFDAQDTKRTSYLSDNAFWLYLLASPLIVHGFMVFIVINNLDAAWLISNQFIMLIFFILFFLLALLIDRRVILISTQLYMVYAITQFMTENFTDTQDKMIIGLIMLSFLIIYFGAYWYKTRRILFSSMANGFFINYVPDFDIRDSENISR